MDYTGLITEFCTGVLVQNTMKARENAAYCQPYCRHHPFSNPRRRFQGQGTQSRRQPVIGFGAGEPDFPTPAHIVEAARQALNDPKNFRYSPSAGLPELKQAIAEKTLRDSGVQVEPSQVLVTNGGKQAVYEAFAAVIDTGDDVLYRPLPGPPT